MREHKVWKGGRGLISYERHRHERQQIRAARVEWRTWHDPNPYSAKIGRSR